MLPSHLLDGKDRHKVMKDGYAFSGGPWKLDGGAAGWKKGKTITLVPNDKYWGTKPTIAKVVFQFIPETAAELQAVKTGQVVAAYPLPQDGILDTLGAQSNLTATVSFGNSFEAMFLNHDAFPLDSAAVRQAVVYATDRQAIVDQVLKPSIKQGRVLQSFVVPTFKQYYVPAFAEYKPDQSKVDSLMTGDGWTEERQRLDQERSQGRAHRVDHDRQHGPLAHRAAVAEPDDPGRLQRDDQEPEPRRAVQPHDAPGSLQRDPGCAQRARPTPSCARSSARRTSRRRRTASAA